MSKITQQQASILMFLVEETKRNLYQPSLREVQEHFGFKSVNAVHGHIRALQRKGYLGQSNPGQARCIPILKRTAKGGGA